MGQGLMRARTSGSSVAVPKYLSLLTNVSRQAAADILICRGLRNIPKLGKGSGEIGGKTLHFLCQFFL